MASITELTEGKHYRIRVSCGKDADGKYRTWSEYVLGTKTEAKRRAAEMEATKDRRQAPPTQSITLAEWYAQVRARMAVDHSPTSLISMAFHWRRLNTLLGAAPLAEITRAQVQRAVDRLVNAPFIADKDKEEPRRLSVATVRKIVGLLKFLCNKAIARGLIAANPVDQIEIPQQRKAPLVCPSLDEIRALQKALADEPLPVRVCVSLMLYTGVRRGELIGLRWSDLARVTLPDGAAIAQLQVSRATIRHDGNRITDLLKTETSRRVIGAPLALWDLLQQWRAQFPDAQPDDYILRWPATGKWWSVDYPSRLFPAFLKRAGLRHLRAHDARHTYASLLIAAGLDIAQVQALLGHSTPATTLNTYAHLLTPAQSAGATAISTAFGLNICPDSQNPPKTPS